MILQAHHRLLLCALCLLMAAGALQAQPTPADLVDQARVEANRLREPAQKALALVDIAVAWHKLGDERWQKTVAEAREAADSAEEVVAKPMTWRGLALRLWTIAPEQAAELLEKSLKAATALEYAAHRTMVLREIGRGLIPLDPARAKATFEQAAVAAATIDAAIFRAAALRDVASAVAPLDPAMAATLFTDALAAVEAIPLEDETAALARVELLVSWAPTDLPAAVKQADLITDERLREVAFRRMCEALAETNSDAALQVASKLQEPGQRALAMAAIASHLPVQQAETATGIARAALALGAALPAEEQGQLKMAVAVALAPVDLKEALGILETVADPALAGQGLGRIALWMAPTQPVEALKTVQAIEDWDAREEYLGRLAPLLARHDLTQAQTAARELLSRSEKIRALLAIVEEITRTNTPG